MQFGWPIGMPLVRKLEPGLWEIRVHLQRRIVRVFFTTHGNFIVLLHALIKKQQAIPRTDLDLARSRRSQLWGLIS